MQVISVLGEWFLPPDTLYKVMEERFRQADICLDMKFRQANADPRAFSSEAVELIFSEGAALYREYFFASRRRMDPLWNLHHRRDLRYRRFEEMTILGELQGLVRQALDMHQDSYPITLTIICQKWQAREVGAVWESHFRRRGDTSVSLVIYEMPGVLTRWERVWRAGDRLSCIISRVFEKRQMPVSNSKISA